MFYRGHKFKQMQLFFYRLKFVHSVSTNHKKHFIYSFACFVIKFRSRIQKTFGGYNAIVCTLFMLHRPYAPQLLLTTLIYVSKILYLCLWSVISISFNILIAGDSRTEGGFMKVIASSFLSIYGLSTSSLKSIKLLICRGLK